MDEPDDQPPADPSVEGADWDRIAGPFTNVAGAAERIGGEPADVEELIACRDMLGAQLADGNREWVLPTRQFEAFDAMPRLLVAIGYRPQQAWSGWQIAIWLTAPDDDLGGQSAWDALSAGQIDEVLAWARAAGPPEEGPPDLLERVQDLVSLGPDGVAADAGAAWDVLRDAATELLYRPDGE